MNKGVAPPLSPSWAKHLGEGPTGPTGRRVSAKRRWRRFVEQRRRELHDVYPCAMPTWRRWCPKHRVPVPQGVSVPAGWVEMPGGSWRYFDRRTIGLSGVCQSCRDELYEQLAAEYRHAKEDHVNTTTEKEERMNTTTSTDLVERDPEIVDAEIVTTPTTLFGTTDPAEALRRMSTIATALVDVVRDRGLVVKIQGRDHLTAEAWTCLGSMVGIVPVVEWSRPLADGNGWEARVVARTLDGRVVGAAESMCTRSEAKWRTRDEFALRSMSQTRAIGRALRAPLGAVVRIAGYEPAGAEEITVDQPVGAAVVVEDAGPIPADRRPTVEQKQRIGELIARLTDQHPDVDWKTEARRLAGCPGDALTATIAAMLIDKLEARLEADEQAAR